MRAGGTSLGTGSARAAVGTTLLLDRPAGDAMAQSRGKRWMPQLLPRLDRLQLPSPSKMVTGFARDVISITLRSGMSAWNAAVRSLDASETNRHRAAAMVPPSSVRAKGYRVPESKRSSYRAANIPWIGGAFVKEKREQMWNGCSDEHAFSIHRAAVTRRTFTRVVNK